MIKSYQSDKWEEKELGRDSTWRRASAKARDRGRLFKDIKMGPCSYSVSGRK